jgi:5'-nucleotidase
MLILVDMDGVVAHFELRFLELWRERFPEEKYIPLDKREGFYIHKEYGPDLYDKVREITSAPGFFLSLPPIDGAIQGVTDLEVMGHQVLICTSPLSGTPTCMQEKYDWVRKYFGREMASSMVITKDKTMVRGDILIDDRPKLEGRFDPTWEHVIFQAPYNMSVVNRRRMRGWFDAIGMFYPKG